MSEFFTDTPSMKLPGTTDEVFDLITSAECVGDVAKFYVHPADAMGLWRYRDGEGAHLLRVHNKNTAFGLMSAYVLFFERRIIVDSECPMGFLFCGEEGDER